MIYQSPLLHFGQTAVKLTVDGDTAQVLDILLSRHNTKTIITQLPIGGYELLIIGDPLSKEEIEKFEQEILDAYEDGTFPINLWEIDEPYVEQPAKSELKESEE